MLKHTFSSFCNDKVSNQFFYRSIMLLLIIIYFSPITYSADNEKVYTDFFYKKKIENQEITSDAILMYNCSDDSSPPLKIRIGQSNIDVIVELDKKAFIRKKKHLKKLFNKANKNTVRRLLKDYDKELLLQHTQFIKELKKLDKRLHKPSKIKRKFRRVFNGFSMKVSKEMVNELNRLSYVKKVYQDGEVRSTLAESVPLIGASSFWNIGISGQGIVVGIIDGGIDYLHPDLGGGFGPGYKVIGGYDFVNDDNDPMDDASHGTHVAGIVAANGTLHGVAPDASLVAYKVMNSAGTGIESDIIAAIERACDPDQDPLTEDALDVINLSLSGPGGPDDPMSVAIDAASEAGVVCVVSSGNSGKYFTLGSPNSARSAITVGASDDNDNIAYFSTCGPVRITNDIKPDLVAPGVNINSTIPGASFGNKHGTSMSAPHVAGLAALIKQAHPDWTPKMIKSALMVSTDDIGEKVFKQGTGRINAFKAKDVETLVIPASLSFGLDDCSETSYEKDCNVNIINTSETVKSYTITIDTDGLPPGIQINTTPLSFTLNPNESQNVLVELVVDNTIVPNVNESPYAYEGSIQIQSGSEISNVPFAFLKSNVITLSFDINPKAVLIHNRVDQSWFFGVTENLYQALVPDGNYDIITRFAEIPEKIIIKENVSAGSHVTINSTDAVHHINISTINELGLAEYTNIGIQKIFHKASGMGFYTMGGIGKSRYVSDASSAYQWEWVHRSPDVTNQYHFIGFLNGFSKDTLLQNRPEDLRHITYHFLRLLLIPHAKG